jgi:hypothetical protein
MERHDQHGTYFIFKNLEHGQTFRSVLPKFPTNDPDYRILHKQRSRFTHYYFSTSGTKFKAPWSCECPGDSKISAFAAIWQHARSLVLLTFTAHGARSIRYGRLPRKANYSSPSL